MSLDTRGVQIANGSKNPDNEQSFKIETLTQLVEGCNTRFVSPVALSNFAKKELEGYPEKLPVYLKNAFLSGAYALVKG